MKRVAGGDTIMTEDNEVCVTFASYSTYQNIYTRR